MINMITYILGCLMILGTSARSPSSGYSEIPSYRPSVHHGQYLVQPIPRGAEIQRGPSQITVVVLPGPPGPFLYTALPIKPSELIGDGSSQVANIYHKQQETSNRYALQTVKTIPFAYAQLVPYPSLKKNIYTPLHQFLKEVTPTTKTVYSEQQPGPLRYVQAASTHSEEQNDMQKQVPQRDSVQQFPVPYAQPEILFRNPIQQQPSQIIDSQQRQDYIQPEQFLQPQPYDESQLQYAKDEAPKYPQNNQDGLTYIPVNSEVYPKPLTDDDANGSKSSGYASQRTPLKKYQTLQPVYNEEDEDQISKSQLRKKATSLQIPQYQPLQQQYLIPIIQQPRPLIQLQRPLVKYQQIQQLSEEQMDNQQLNVKKVLQPQIIAYQQFPIQREVYPNPPLEQLNILKQPIIRYHLQPQILLQQVQPNQPNQLDYQQMPQEITEQQQEPQQEVVKSKEKSSENPTAEATPIRLSSKYRKSSLRSRKFRPFAPKVEEAEEETQTDNQETRQDFSEDFRIQYPDNLKSQPTTYTGLRQQKSVQTNTRFNSRNKDRAVQIIEGEE